MSLRIVSGRLKGRTLSAPRGNATRPTSARVRESLFQHLESAQLEHGFTDLRILDLFAGSGALAIEAISRGALSAVIVESAKDAARAIEENIARLELSDSVRLIRRPLPGGLATAGEHGPFDLVFIDPPYGSRALEPTLQRLATSHYLSDNAIVVIETARDMNALQTPWRLAARREHGGTSIHVFKRRPDVSASPIA